MRLIFLYGQVASGKLTIARALADRTGHALFHNHLVVDAVGAVFPFGSAPFIALREAFWLRMFEAAAREGRSLIFTFAPESTMAADFPQRAADIVRTAGGAVTFVALTVDPGIQSKRIANDDRAAFGKLRSPDMLQQLRADFDAAMAAMPSADLVIDTGLTAPQDAAALIQNHLAGEKA